MIINTVENKEQNDMLNDFVNMNEIEFKIQQLLKQSGGITVESNNKEMKDAIEKNEKQSQKQGIISVSSWAKEIQDGLNQNLKYLNRWIRFYIQ